MIDNFVSKFNKFKVTPRAIPAFLFFACLISYGLMAPFLGFYQDDWHFIYYYITRGAPGIIELAHYDGHPLSAWIYILAFRALGVSPLAWQLFSIFWRWLAAVAAWKLLHQFWPNHLKQTFTAALFFLLYPAFILQPQAICYSEVWISHTVLLWSFYYAGRGIQENKFRYHIFGFIIKILHVFTSAYVTGLEFVRLFIIWMQIPKDQTKSFRKRLKMAIWLWLPYLLINLGYIIWRVFLYNSPVEKRADPTVIFTLLDTPIQTIQLLLNNLFPDLILILATSWYSVLTPSIFSYSNLINGLLLGIMLLSALSTWLAIHKMSSAYNQESQNFPANALLIGALLVLFGLAPYYAIGYFMYEKFAPWNSRVALGSLLGAGLLVSYLFYALVTNPRRQNIALAILIAFMIGWQVRNANEFRQSWNKQLTLYEQLFWRIPGLQKNTAILSEQEILFFMGDYPTSFAINSIYGQPTPLSEQEIPYWFFPVSSSFWGKESVLASGTPLNDQQHSIYFAGDSKKSILIRFEPQDNECLWVIRPEDAYSRAITPSENLLAPISDLSRITENVTKSPLEKILLSRSSRNWCYFYQKADLARQFQRWQDVVQFWQQAEELNKRPANGFEYIPFIEGYANTGDWKTARNLTDVANRISPAMYHSLCPVWKNLYTTTPNSSMKNDEYQEVIHFLGCVP
ncbi:MAG: hypothetical protein L6461_24415 [Anaerolineae bacterium]|nr:hypothetical protein [Anaerolineae bacterium]